jgi:ATP-dependent Clp protease ATP-binding subunit ClpX
MENASKVVVDESVVNGENKPYIMYESDESRRDEKRPAGSAF